jgi:ATP-dependent Zn protease
MKSNRKHFIVGVVVILLGVLGWMVSGHGRPQIKASYSQFLQQVRDRRVASVIIAASNSGANEATYRLKEGDIGRTLLPSDYRDALAAMQENLVDIEIQTGRFPLLLSAAPFLLLLAVWVFLMGWKRNGARPLF